MASRIDLQSLLESVLGNKNVYFQAPSNRLDYPCIIYKLNNIDTKKADNINYLKTNCYQVTLIHRDPDNEIKDTLLDLPHCKFDRSFISDNLHHYVYTLYF